MKTTHTPVITEPTCKYCNKHFRKESSLAVHMCEKKRRWKQEKDTGVQLGLRAYLRFYETTQGNAKLKNYGDFVESPYYSSFVKFGQYLIQIRAINISAFIDWIISQNKKLDSWTNDSHYGAYIYEYTRKENPMDALERSVNEIQRWATESKLEFTSFFREGSPYKICAMIANGRISPWVIYSCDSGIDFLASLNTEQLALIYKFIDPVFWQGKLSSYASDSEFIKSVLSQASI